MQIHHQYNKYVVRTSRRLNLDAQMFVGNCDLNGVAKLVGQDNVELRSNPLNKMFPLIADTFVKSINYRTEKQN